MKDSRFPSIRTTTRWESGAIHFFEILKYVDVLMPNEREVCEMMRESDADRAIRRLANMVPLLVVKRDVRGARGA